MNTTAGSHGNDAGQHEPLRPGSSAARREAFRRKTLKEHIWGPSGSVLLHVGIVAILLNLMLGATPPPPENTYPTVRHDLDDQFKPDPPTAMPDTPEPERQPEPTPPAPLQPPGAASIADMMSTLPPVTPDFMPTDVVLDGVVPLIASPLPARTKGNLKKLGDMFLRPGGHGTNDARIVRALEWLRDHQQPEGCWGTGEGTGGHRVAMTGLALLTFLAHGEKPTSPDFGATVEKAIHWLTAQQHEDGAFLRLNDNTAVYEHGIATYAIAEAYTLTRVIELRAVMERAVARIVSGQQDTGAFTYQYAMNGRRDTSVTGWQAQALIAARIANAEAPGLEEAMARCVQALKMNYDAATGRFRYAPEADRAGGHTTAACTGIGVLSLQLLGHAKSAEVEGGIEALKGAPVAWRTTELGDWPLYAWYYITQTKFHRSRREWDAWSEPFYNAMWAAQNADGSWTPAGANEKTHGRVYGTTFTALTLMVYFRHLPTYKQDQAAHIPTPLLLPPLEDGPVVDLDG